jgi:TolB protein
MVGLSSLFPMRTPFRLFLLLFGLTLGSAARAQIPDIVVTVGAEATPIDVSVTSDDPQLENLARIAFKAHGRYRLVGVASSPKYALRFTLVAPNQVRADIGGGILPLPSQLATGADKSDALLRAADAAVTATCQLKGFFASKLAFVGKRNGVTEIYTSNLFVNGVVRPVTGDRKQLMFPRWSPNGADIIYTSLKTGFPDVVLIDLASRQRTNIASFKGTNGDARFSADGHRIAMVLSGEGSTEVYVSDARGGGISRKTHSIYAKSSPCFSPDGTELIFAMESGPRLYRMPAAGGAPQRLQSDLDEDYHYFAEPDWSRADPKKIAFTVGVGGNHYQVFVGELSGTDINNAKKVSGKVGSLDAQEPVWLADGRHLVCTAKLTGDRSSLWLVDTETFKATQLTRPESFGACSEASVLDP